MAQVGSLSCESGDLGCVDGGGPHFTDLRSGLERQGELSKFQIPLRGNKVESGLVSSACVPARAQPGQPSNIWTLKGLNP